VGREGGARGETCTMSRESKIKKRVGKAKRQKHVALDSAFGFFPRARAIGIRSQRAKQRLSDVIPYLSQRSLIYVFLYVCRLLIRHAFHAKVKANRI